MECDISFETGRGIHAIEVKSRATITSDYFGSLNRVVEVARTVVYAGAARQTRSDCRVVPATELA